MVEGPECPDLPILSFSQIRRKIREIADALEHRVIWADYFSTSDCGDGRGIYTSTSSYRKRENVIVRLPRSGS